MKKTLLIIGVSVLLAILIFESASSEISENPSSTPVLHEKEKHGMGSRASMHTSQPTSNNQGAKPLPAPHETYYTVTNVVDGDTLDVLIDGKTERIRLIGINTPETVDPRKPVECFGTEASTRAKSLLTGTSVHLVTDDTQGDRDKYGRLLRYVFLVDGTNVNLKMIEDGYAYEYTYDVPYEYQEEFRVAESRAREAGAGLWGASCDTAPKTTETNTQSITADESNLTTAGSCVIKGNINAEGEKIYHLPGCGSYEKTKIDESRGEAWFCTESEARDAGWRKALNC